MSEWRNKDTVVLGLGISGKAAAQLLLGQGASVTGLDDQMQKIAHDPEVLALQQKGMQLGSFQGFSPQSVLIVSPGIAPEHPIMVLARQQGIQVIGEVELASSFIRQRCIGITGTNGKTTTTLLVTHILNQSGIPAKALGNVGMPIAAEVAQEHENDVVFVIELSSFQLETMHRRFFDQAVILNITPDHLDRYADMQGYAKAKCRIENCLKEGGQLVVSDQVKREFGDLLSGQVKTYGYTEAATYSCNRFQVFHNQALLFPLPLEYKGLVSHDVENMMAAYALVSPFGITIEQFLSALSSFAKPPHRIEFVSEINGVAYIDDSKGTNIDAVIRAVQALPGPILLIAGGIDKGFPYHSWISSFAGKVRQICAIGASSQKIHEQLASSLPVEVCANLEEAIHYATKLARPGETILLSPGCASYDMFKNYEHRGQEFKRLVNNLRKS